MANASTISTVSLTWSAPSAGTALISYTINYRVTETTTWMTYVSDVSSTARSVTGLSASTSYEFEVFASSASGSGTPSVAVFQSITTARTSVTAVTWNLAPSGSYTHGSGSTGVNAQIAPSGALVQFGFSTSPTVPPANWTQAPSALSRS
jgi:hypothetical protein